MMLKEGLAEFFIPDLPDVLSKEMPVFYNPFMSINRDFTVLMLKAYSKLKAKKLFVADPMSASGIRVLRLLKETDVIEKAFLNDIKKEAIELSKKNLEGYQNIEYFNKDAKIFLLENKGFDYIDLDPYGSPIPFLESAINALKTGGLIGITATDTASLSGSYPFKAFRRYGSKPLESEFYHESALRILIKSVIEASFRLDVVLKPIFGFSYRHFLRIFFIKLKGVSKAIDISTSIGYIGYCHSCKFRESYTCILDLPKFCPLCGDFFDYGGPLYIGPIYGDEFLNIIKNEDFTYFHKDTVRLFKTILKEASVKSPWFYKANIFGKGTMPKLKNILKDLNAKPTHFSPEGFKTDLEFKYIKEYFDRWV
ncbi:tRNA (guanine(26)-N(2))-dimethyltransferase [Hydrogenobaculum acidophilum]